MKVLLPRQGIPAMALVAVLAGVAGTTMVMRPKEEAPSPSSSTSSQPSAHHPEALAVIRQFQKECDPDTVGSDYAWSTRAMPTEGRRMALLERCRAGGKAWLHAVQAQIVTEDDDSELGQMLVLAALAMGDVEQVLPVCRLMAWSDYPAVRICAARELRRLHDPRTKEWFETALDDERFVLNSDCGTVPERYYPVRTVAALALEDLRQAAN